jgi:hypothetical protein
MLLVLVAMAIWSGFELLLLAALFVAAAREERQRAQSLGFGRSTRFPSIDRAT